MPVCGLFGRHGIERTLSVGPTLLAQITVFVNSGRSTLTAIGTAVIKVHDGNGVGGASRPQLIEPLLGRRNELPWSLRRSLLTCYEPPAHEVAEQRVKRLYGVIRLGSHHPDLPTT
jgi:hypothetical protein